MPTLVMLKDEWEQEYEQLLEEGKSSGELSTVPEDEEKRNSPRFRILSGAVWIRMDTSFDVIDVSVSGISFYSDQQFELGQVLAVTLGKAFKIEAEIVHCELAEPDPNSGEARYLTRCHFLDKHSSMRFLLMLKGMDEGELTIAT